MKFIKRNKKEKERKRLQSYTPWHQRQSVKMGHHIPC